MMKLFEDPKPFVLSGVKSPERIWNVVMGILVYWMIGYDYAFRIGELYVVEHDQFAVLHEAHQFLSL